MKPWRLILSELVDWLSGVQKVDPKTLDRLRAMDSEHVPEATGNGQPERLHPKRDKPQSHPRAYTMVVSDLTW